MVAKTIGFNWGPAGTSCSQWTGVRLADVLQHCGMQGPEKHANYVCFRGPKHELPQGVAAQPPPPSPNVPAQLMVRGFTITGSPAACCASRVAAAQYVRVQSMRRRAWTRRMLLMASGQYMMAKKKGVQLQGATAATERASRDIRP